MTQHELHELFLDLSLCLHHDLLENIFTTSGACSIIRDAVVTFARVSSQTVSPPGLSTLRPPLNAHSLLGPVIVPIHKIRSDGMAVL